MGFLIKAAFWLSVVVLLLPAPESNDASGVRMIGTTEAVSLLSAALNDARGFCQRNPDACVTGSQAAQTFGHKAQYATRLLHDFISEKLEDGQSAKAAAITQGAGSAIRSRQATGGSDTLSPADLEPVWRAPEARQAAFKRS